MANFHKTKNNIEKKIDYCEKSINTGYASWKVNFN